MKYLVDLAVTYIVIFVCITLSGCATRPPASCDGSQRRPINQATHAGHFPNCGAEVVA